MNSRTSDVGEGGNHVEEGELLTSITSIESKASEAISFIDSLLGVNLPTAGENEETDPLQVAIEKAVASFLGGNGEEGGSNPLQAMIQAEVAAYLSGTGEEGGGGFLSQYTSDLELLVHGNEKEGGQGGLKGELIALVRGNEKEGIGGLKGELVNLVRGGKKDEGKGGLLGELRDSVHGKGGLMQVLDTYVEALKQSIYKYWYNLIGRYIKEDSIGEKG